VVARIPAKQRFTIRRSPIRRGLLAATVAWTLTGSPGFAQDTDRQDAVTQSPVLVSADELIFDEKLGIVTASGNVELSQGDRILLADTVTYNQNTKVVTASGNIRLLEPTGEVEFADYAELTDDLGRGFADQLRVLMTDNSRLAAAEGERTDNGMFTRLNRAVYSPCNLCAEDPTRPPLWQVRAVRIVHDKEAKDIIYRDAWMEMFGIPVFYTPYLSHPDPTVERRTGMLPPTFGASSNVGTLIDIPYYFDIAPDKDATVGIGWSEEDGPRLSGEWRQRFENGRLRLEGSGIVADRTDTDGTLRQNEVRGHLFGDGLFDINDVWRWGFDVQRTTDDSYLRRYGLYSEDILRSRAFIEGFKGRNYGTATSILFQDLRPGSTENVPTVFPLAYYNGLGEPGSLLGGRWSFDTGVVGLNRARANDTHRASAAVGWERDFFSNTGFVTTVSADVRSDAYYYNSVGTTDPEDDSETALRLFPQSQVMVRYPLVRQTGTVQQLIEPMAALTVAPNVDQSDIPNEDSRGFEFDETNLFSRNRFAGVDRLETGSRLSYGLKLGAFGFGGGNSSLFVGQSYRFSDRQDFNEGSGVEDQLSDYVGALTISPNAWLDLFYRFRLDKDDLTPRRHSVTAVGGVPQLRVGVNYLFIDKPVNTISPEDIEEVTLSASSALTRYWSISGAHKVNLEDNTNIGSSVVLTYQDECFTFQAIGARSNTTRADLDRGNAIYFRLVFKNLGEIESPSISTGTSYDSTPR
jgi:LPS-assembly protein